MTIRSKITLVRAAIRSVRYFLGGRVRFPRDRLGYVLETPDGDSFLVYRETALGPVAADASDERVVLVFRMRVTGREVWRILRDALFDPLANVATPFFAGMPGFGRKLWLAGERPGEFLELYEWASAEDAERFVAVMESLLAPFDFAGSASFEVVEDDTIDEYVAARSVAWHRDTTTAPVLPRRRRPARLVLAAVAVLAAGYLVWKCRSVDWDPAPTGEEQT